MEESTQDALIERINHWENVDPCHVGLVPARNS